MGHKHMDKFTFNRHTYNTFQFQICLLPAQDYIIADIGSQYAICSDYTLQASGADAS
jgi:hypothetical protein